jgi:hypothetical protein
MANMVVTAGTEGDGIIDNILFDNITFPATYNNWAFTHEGQVGTVTIKNVDLTSTSDAYAGGFFHGNVTGGKASFTELIIDNCNFAPTKTNGTFINFIANASYDFTKLTCTNDTINITSGYLITPTTGIKTFNFSNTKFTGLNRLLSTAAGQTFTANFTLTNCEFATPLAYIMASTIATANVINYTSTGTKYVDPSGNLFFNNQAAATMNINVSSSTGTITAAKVRNGVLVNIIACDIPYI